NQRALVLFLKELRKRLPQKNIWCYTAYTYQEAGLAEPQANCAATREMISLLDVLVDGPFVEDLKDIRLKFRGSSNQRVIDVAKSLASGRAVLYLD
ncbi:MAG: radical SAM protein, partial [Clostridia bacterium]|nr:radical SAM protein [Clostridia bacterium]